MHLCELCVLCGYWSSIFSHVGRPQAGDAYARDDKWRNPFVAPLVRGRRPRSWPGVPSPHGMLSERVAHYRIVEKLGQGGMGEIFSAYDEKLKRTVAIKRISLATLPDDRSRRQFLREARAAAALNHPFICTIHEVLEHEGEPLIVMEHVQGKTLDACLIRGPLPSDEVIARTIEIAEALAAAHARGIVHRDIKSNNIMITTGGHVKVMDFGLAIITASSDDDTARLSERSAGAIAGTLPYIAAEVLRGEPASAASDLYALGVVMYEMTTGRRPFTGQTGALLISAVLNDAPVPPRQLNRVIPQPLSDVVLSLLSKDPFARPSAPQLIARVRGLASTNTRQERSLAVLPFRALTTDADSAHLGLALADATIGELALVRSLLVRPSAAILRYDRTDVDALEAGRELGVDAIVAGTFQRAGSRLRVSVQLINVGEERPLWSTKIDTTMDDIFAMQDEVSRKIVAALQMEITPADEMRLERRPQAAGDVMDLLLKGRAALLGGESSAHVTDAIECFQKAADLAPDNPLILVGLADAYTRMAFTWDPDADWHERAQRLAHRALQLDPDLPEGRYIRARLAWTPHGGFDHGLAISEMMAALAGRPNMTEAYGWLGIVLFHVGLIEEARDRFARALRINPSDLIAATHEPSCDIVVGDYDRALPRAREALSKLSSPWSVYTLAQAQVHVNDLSGAEKTLASGAQRFPATVLFHSLRALIAALRNDVATVEREMERTMQGRKSFGHYHHSELDLACALSVLGRTGEALEALRSVVRTGYPCLPAFETSPMLAAVRREPGYGALKEELRQMSAGYRELFANLRSSLSAP